MFVLISYDIAEDKTRTKLAHQLRDFGPRVQYSVFEAEITEAEHQRLHAILAKIKLGPTDSIRVYEICRNCVGKVQIWGQGEVTEDKPYYIA
jgi:CRISPR-associated protein Cas2